MTTPLRSVVLVFLAACGDAPSVGLDGGTQQGDGGNPPGTVPVRSCKTTFVYKPTVHMDAVAVAGEWTTPAFDPVQGAMAPQADGSFRVDLTIPAGDYGYKIVTGTQPNLNWILDPANAYTKWVGGFENSLVEVGDCNAPQLLYVKLDKSAASATGATYVATAQYVDGAMKSGLDQSKLGATVDGAAAKVTVDKSGIVTVAGGALDSSKHRIIVSAIDKSGRAADALHIPFWGPGNDAFQWGDGMLYFAFTDRFLDGNPANDMQLLPGMTSTPGDPQITTTANFQGGDYAGITQKIDAGYFDLLDVRMLWVSPPNPVPGEGWPGTENPAHEYTGYHGYWPTGGTTVDPRWGTLDEMKTMVQHAHRHGIRVLVDGVLNHVHTDHPYWQMHQSDGWFNPLMINGHKCVCGAAGCGNWDNDDTEGNLGLFPRLTCWFTEYLPDLNYENFDAAKTMVDDALFWAREVDVDGYRVDAVKHFLEIVPTRLRSKLQDQFEHGTPLYYLVGETFTGDRGLIAHYIGPHELNAQFEFPVYFSINDCFANNSPGGLKGLDDTLTGDEQAFGDAPMSPFLDNQDVARFVTTAAGQLNSDQKWQAFNQPPGAPADSEPYKRLRLALSFLYTMRGVPLIYYGDEIGQPGTGDPDNRRMMRFDGLSSDEQATLDWAKMLAAARRELVALQRGLRFTMWVDMIQPQQLYVYARVTIDGKVAIVVINRAGQERTESVPVPATVPLATGAVLKDRLSGATITFTGGNLAIDVPAETAQVFAP